MNEREREHELAAEAIAAENVRRLLAGEIYGTPEPGTLAHRVWMWRFVPRLLSSHV